MRHRMIRKPGWVLYDHMVGSQVCARNSCPSEEHHVWFLKNDRGEAISTRVECRLCGIEDTWGDKT